MMSLVDSTSTLIVSILGYQIVHTKVNGVVSEFRADGSGKSGMDLV